MKILLDECVPWPMHRLLANYSCANVQTRGWGGIKNGELLRLAETDFDLFITSDQNIRYQQNLAGHKISVRTLDQRYIASALKQPRR
jgi:predicted nuclease of predicted toxin-antitoxin system